ncbi:unnamed protein product [Mortierella alpina]
MLKLEACQGEGDEWSHVLQILTQDIAPHKAIIKSDVQSYNGKEYSKADNDGNMAGMSIQIANCSVARVKFTDLTMQFLSSLSGILIGAYSQEYVEKFKDEAEGGDVEQQENLHFIRSSIQKPQLQGPSMDFSSNEEKAAEDLEEQLKAYCKVARKRIADVMILQTLERHMVKYIDVYSKG